MLLHGLNSDLRDLITALELARATVRTIKKNRTPYRCASFDGFFL
jgi:hypothetical protein